MSFPASQDAAHDVDTLQRYKVSPERSMRWASRTYLVSSHVQSHEMTEAPVQVCFSACHRAPVERRESCSDGLAR